MKGPMYKGIYTGDKAHLFNRGALLMFNNGRAFAQFDAVFLSEAFGWHEFDTSDFVIIEKIGD